MAEAPLQNEFSMVASGLPPENLLEVMQAVAASVHVTFNFASGATPVFQVYMPGAAMAEQKNNKVKTGDISGSTIGSIGSARDVTVYQNQVENSGLGADEKKALIEARKQLEAMNLNPKTKTDVADDLDKVTRELQESQPDEGRLRRLLRNIKEVAAPVASALSIAASIYKLMH